MSTENFIINKCLREKNTLIALFVVMCLLFGTVFFSQSYKETRNLQRKNTYGFHNGCVYGVTGESIESIIQHQSVVTFGTMTIHGQIMNHSGLKIGSIGTIDPAFHELEKLDFLEGTYPKAQNEIALEHFVLDQLNIPYQLGISLSLDISLSNGETVNQTFQLCGILKSYSTNWKTEGFDLCNAILSSCEYPVMQRHLFFYGEYDNYEQMEELAALTTGRLVFNDYSYPVKNYTFPELVSDGMIVVMAALIGGLFLICLQISGYKKQLHRMRVLLTIGADRKELFRAWFRQAVKDWSITYVLSAVVCTIISISIKAVGFGNFQFKLTLLPYALSGVLSFLVIFAGKAAQISLLNRISILPKGRDLTQYETKIKSNDKRTLQTEQEFIKIQLRRNIKQYFIELVLIITSLSVIFVCVHGLCGSLKKYKTTVAINGHDYSWVSVFPSSGLSYPDILKIANTANIESVVYTSNIASVNNNSIYITYQDYKADDYVYCVNTSYGNRDNALGMLAHIVVLPENSIVWDYYIPKNMDVTSFVSGEGVILFLPEMAEVADDFYQAINTFDINTSQNTKHTYTCNIDVGDEITVNIGNSGKNTTCLHIMRRFPSAKQTTLDFLLPGSILVSEKLYKELTDSETILYTSVFAFGNDDLSYDVGDKLMSAITANKSIRFTNNRIEKATAKQLLLTDLISLGTVAVIVGGLSIIILYWNRQYLYAVEQYRISLLKNIGCNQSFIKKMYDTRAEYCLIPYTLIINASTIFTFAYRDYSDFVAVDNIFSTWSAICALAFRDFSWPLLMIPQVAFLSIAIYITKRSPASLTR